MSITRQQALDCFASDDLIGMGMEADAIRRSLHPEGVVTYVLNQVLCVATPGFQDRAADATEAGATGVTLRGELADLLGWEAVLQALRSRFPSLWLHGLSATAVAGLSNRESRSVRETLVRLQAAGLQSLAGDDAVILTRETPSRHSEQAWLDVHRKAQGLGLPSTAAIRFGAGESAEDFVAHLQAIANLQGETGGFVSLRPSSAPLPNFEEATAVEYLKTLAIARMMLNTIPHLEADWPAQGLKVLQMALRFGANDAGSALAGEARRNPDGTTEEDLRRVIRGAELRPVERDTAYRTVFLG